MLEGRSLWEFVERRADASPDATMMVDDGGRTMTFGAYREAAERAAAGFAALGVADGDRVSWQLPTWIETCVLAGALSRLGAVQNPVLPIYRAKELGFVIRQTEAKVLVVPTTWRSVDFQAMAEGIVEGTPTRVVTCDRVLPEGDPAYLAGPPTPSDHPPVRWLYYTSGTTADPKGAQHTDLTILAAAVAMSERLQLTAADRSGVVFPFTHIAGVIWIYASLMSGCSMLLTEAFDPVGTTEFLARADVTLAGSGTFFHLAYLNAQRERAGQQGGGAAVFPNVRAYPGGGAPKPPQLHYDLKKEIGGVGVVSGYGLTECPILSMASVDDPDDKLADTEGTLCTGVDVRVVSTEGADVGPAEEGELRVKAPQRFLGYLDASLDAEAFDDEGYFRTGDLGFVDADGYVVITGRLKDIIIRKGENVSAKELEDLLYQHPSVGDVAVIGLADPESGERVCAVVATKEGAAPLTFEAMQAFCDEHGLMKQKWPEQLEIVDAVPRNPAGKVLKHELREQFA